MCNEKIGQSQFFLKLLEHVDYLGLDGYIQCGYRLITHNELRIYRQGARNADTLTLSA